MASTSSNKQPLLVDRPLHSVYNVDKAITGNPAPGQSSASVDILGTNTAVPAVNAISTDGAIVEDVYTIARGTTARYINLYFSWLNPRYSLVAFFICLVLYFSNSSLISIAD